MKGATKIQIAIADDHSIFRAGLKGLINSFPEFNVVIDAPDGRSLIDKIEKSKTNIDICVLDVTMPILNGYETLIVLRARWPKIKVLILTMHNGEFPVIKLLRGGANGYLQKGADPQELHTALKEIHERGFYSSELITNRFYNLIQGSKERHTLLDISDKELQFLTLCTLELSYKEIAQKMGLSARTVEGYRDALFVKLDLKSRTGLIVYAFRTGLIADE